MPRKLAARTFGGTKMTDAAAMQKDRHGGDTSAFQHRHFAAVADIIRNMDKVNNQEHGFIDIREDVAEHFAAAFRRGNPKFSTDRFLIACGVAKYEG